MSTTASELFADLERVARDLDSTLREKLADEWSLAARFEHASIASFNKFSLELLALGAPGELVAGANRAALQEVEHARASFALASAYAGRRLGPGPLMTAGLDLGAVDLVSVAAAATREGCVEETLAAAEAAGAKGRATVPAVLWVLGTIAREEREHAALAYRFVRWACSVGGPPVREAVERAFREALAACRADRMLSNPTGTGDLELEPHGRLAAATRQSLREHVCNEVLEPSLRELVGDPGPPP